MSQFTNEFGQPLEIPRPKPQVTLANCPFLTSSYPTDWNYIQFMNSCSNKNFRGMMANFEYI